ncbi:MAG: glycosyltransferase family 32 protein [Kluyvera sp.]|uniref:glycosyltransferase family 32 protein n=1 Tax=Kluyvera sp. TaxID=1538228 RepID=UPI003A873BB4
MIPKIIHYCWFGSNPLPELTKKCIESWKKYCPDYKIIRWDESNVDLESCLFVREAYASKKWAFVSDYIRLKVVSEHGGIYLDTDVELLKPLDNLLQYPAYMGFESNKNCVVNSGLGFGAEQGHPFFLSLLAEYEQLSFVNELGDYDMTPCVLRETRALMRLGLKVNGKTQILKNIIILSEDYLCPISLLGVSNFTENTYSIHHYDASWLSDVKKKGLERKKKLIKVFGLSLGSWINKPIILIDEIRDNGLLKTIKKIFS